MTATPARRPSSPGNHTVSETGAGTTDLAKYDKSIECKLGTTTVASEQRASLSDVPVDSNQTVICTITNTRRQGTIQVVKDLIPSTDPGSFDLKVDGSTVKAGAVDGDSGSAGVAPGNHTVSETGAGTTDLAKYDKSIECKLGTTTVASGSGASLSNVPVDSNQTVVCTITNTRRQGTIQVVKDLIPSTDPGSFDLKVDGSTVKAGAVDGDSGSAGVSPGNHTVSETGAGTTDLAKYTSSIECKLGTTTVASARPRASPTSRSTPTRRSCAPSPTPAAKAPCGSRRT